MPRLAPADRTLLEGRVLLFKRPNSRVWQVTFKVAGRYLRLSTKQLGKEDAAAAALDLYMEARFKQKHGMQLSTRRFKDIALLAIAEMERALKEDRGKSV